MSVYGAPGQRPARQQLEIAAQLYDMRNKARRLLGDRYKARMAELGEFLTENARCEQKDPLDVAIELCNRRNLVGIDLMMVVAAAVELAEPTPNA